MIAVTETGGVIFPPVPAFRSKARSTGDIVNHTVGRVPGLFDVRYNDIARRQGMRAPAAKAHRQD